MLFKWLKSENILYVIIKIIAVIFKMLSAIMFSSSLKTLACCWYTLNLLRDTTEAPCCLFEMKLYEDELCCGTMAAVTEPVELLRCWFGNAPHPHISASVLSIISDIFFWDIFDSELFSSRLFFLAVSSDLSPIKQCHRSSFSSCRCHGDSLTFLYMIFCISLAYPCVIMFEFSML